MASEVAELSSINDEDLLRRMWQQSEDFGRKKEIRAHMYKLREERLRNFYTGDMDGGMSKSPMIPSHGDSLADQSFQSFKAKEIRDSESPTRHLKYGMVQPDTSGWNVITSSEISSDGKGQINSTLATTDAVKDVPGGKSSFSGKNEQVDSHRHDGDDKNYTSTSGHTSNTVLKEHVVVGDANNGRTESTSNTTSSSTKIIKSSKFQSDNNVNDDLVQEFEDVLNSAKRSVRENANKTNGKNEQFERIPCDDFDKECYNTCQNNSKTTNKSFSQSNQQSTHEIRRNSLSSTTSSIDAKKIQRETEYLANAPGQLISRSVEYPDANTKVITETKTLPDGSTVTTTKYETRAASSAISSKASKQEKSSTSRTITEDRAERNRIEVIKGDNRNVVEEVLNSRQVIDDDNRRKSKPDQKETITNITVKQDVYRNDDVNKGSSRQEIRHQENTTQQNVSEENYRRKYVPEQKETVTNITVKQDVYRNDDVNKGSSRQEIRHQENTTQQNVSEENIRRKYVPEQKETVTNITVKQDVYRNDDVNKGNSRQEIRHQQNTTQQNVSEENIRRKYVPEQKETVTNITVKQDVYRNDDVNKGSSRQEIRHEENTTHQNVSEENIRRKHVQQHQTNERRPSQINQDNIEQKVHHENVFSERVEENVSSHDRSNTNKEQNENLINRVEMTINTDRVYNNKDRNSHSSKIVDDKVSAEKHKTVKKDLSHDHERYIKSQTYENEKPNDQYDRQPVQEEEIVPKKQIYHVCSPSHDHSVKSPSQPEYTSKRISVDHNPTHEAFARSLRCVTPEKDKRSSTHSVKSNYTYTDHGRRSPSRDTNVSDTSKFSSTTVTKSSKYPRNTYDTPLSPTRKPSPDKRKSTTQNVSSAISSETIDIITSENEQKQSKRVESTTRKTSQNNVSTKQTSNFKSEDHYDHPRNNKPVHVKSTVPTDESSYYDIPRNNTPVHSQDEPNRNNSSDQPSYLRPTASSARHNIKPDYTDAASKPKKHTKDNREPIYETISDRPSNDRRQPLKTDSRPTYTSSVTRETEDYRNFKKSFRKQPATQQHEYEPEFDSGRSNSPTSSVSDIEYVNFSTNTKKVTDLDSEHSDVEKVTTRTVTTEDVEKRYEDTQDGLMFSSHKKKASSPSLESDTDTIIEHDDQPKEPFYLVENQKERTPENFDKVPETRKEKPPLTRSETYEERCRTMLGMKSPTDDILDEQTNTTTSKVKNLKETSIDFIRSEQNVENVRRSVTISPDRKNVTKPSDKNVDRSPSRSPDRKRTTFSKSITETSNVKNSVETEDNHFDTFTRTKNHQTSPKRTPQSSPERKDKQQPKQPLTDQNSRKPSKTNHVKDSSPVRSVDSSPDRKGKTPYQPPLTDQYSRKPLKTNHVKDSSPVRSVDSSPDRKGKTPYQPPLTDQYSRKPLKTNHVKDSSPVRSVDSSPDRIGKTPDQPLLTDQNSRKPLKTNHVKDSSPVRSVDSSPDRIGKTPDQPLLTDQNSRKPLKTNHVKDSSPVRSVDSSPDRKGKTPDSVTEITKKFMKHETRSNSFTSKTTKTTDNGKTKDNNNLPSNKPTDANPEREPKFKPRDFSPSKKSPNRSPNTSPVRKTQKESIIETTKNFIKSENHTEYISRKDSQTEILQKTNNEVSSTSKPKSPNRSPVRSRPEVSSTSKPNSPNRSPVRSRPVNEKNQPDYEVETVKNLKSSNVSQKTNQEFLSTSRPKSPNRSPVRSRPVNDRIQTDSETETVTSLKSSNKTVKNITKSGKSPTREKKTPLPSGETLIETTDTFFSETKTDTIKRRPTSPNKTPVEKSNSSPDRRPARPIDGLHRRPVNEEVNRKSSPKKSSHLVLNTDNQDGTVISTDTFTRKKTKESIEVLTSPTKPKSKVLKTNPDTLSPTRPQTTSTKFTSPTSKTIDKTKTKSVKVEVSTKTKSKSINNYSTDDESENETKTTKPTKKVPVIERKDSAPVYRSTKVDKDAKMSRSTSEHFSSPTRKRSKPEIETLKSPQKFDKRPTKCVTTKTINLSATNTLNSEDMENVIIDIQQAKSSREPTPNRIIPTPVSPEEDTGKPRYPDTVHEPDDTPKRRPNIKNIPIFEEDTKEFISCHITEVSDEYDAQDSDECMLSVSDKVTKFSSTVTSPTKDKSYRRIIETVDESLESDECLLSVHDKVSKFIATAEDIKIPKSSRDTRKDHTTSTSSKVNEKVAQFTTTAEEVMKTKTSAPFKPEPISDTDLIEDDCLLTVNDKVTKFLTTTDSVTKSVNKADHGIRQEYEDIDEDLKSDECLMSVHDKVNKFVTTAEKLTAIVPQKSPELVAKIERQVSRRDKTTDKVDNEERPDDEYDIKVERPIRSNGTPKGASKTKITDRYVPNKTKPSTPASVPITLQSIDVVKKAKSIFEKDNSPKAPKQRDILSRPSIWEDRRSKEAKPDVKLTDIGVYQRSNDSKDSSPEPRQTSRSPDQQRTTQIYEHKKDIFEKSVTPSRDQQIDRSPHQQRTTQIYEHKKDIFEKSVTPTRDQQIDSQKHTQKIDIHNADFKSNHQSHKSHVTEKNLSNDQISASKRKLFVEDRSSTDSRDDRSTSEKPSYMNHTVASLEHIRRDSIEINKSNIRRTTQEDEVDQVEINPRSSVTFGVELKRTNSQQSQPTRRKSSCSEIPHIEEIFELELLERMLETVVGYEQRRRIRAQIRLVKKQIQDEEIEIELKKARNVKRSEIKTEVRKHESSPVRKSSPTRKHNGDASEYISKNNRNVKSDRTTSPVRKHSPIRKQIDVDEYISSSERKTSHKEQSPVRRSSPNRKHFIEENSSTYRTERINREFEKSRSPSPKSNKISTTTSNLRNNEVRQVNTSKYSDDDRPIWATKNILKKASETTRTFKTSSAAKKTTVTKVQKQKTIEPNDDCVTSSYGIGPTDDDGKPLFGIRALKKKSPVSQTSKVSGTIIHETLYSDNGAPPVGNRTTTMYSSDPQDIRHFVETNGSASEIRDRLLERENSRRGMTSVTTSQKIGHKDSPEDLLISVSSPKSAKVVRRGSVKELSEKFIQKESSKSSERTTSSYPKAGLILRTQTSRESTPGANSSLRSGSADFDDLDIEVRCSSSRTQNVIESDEEVEYTTTTSRQRQSHQTQSFLNNTSKVSGVQDVLNRMRNADNVIEDGDTEEDKEARSLLNKFLGASVLMSGMESMVPREVTTIVGKPTSQKQVTTTRVTKTIKSTSSPSSTREIKIRDIDTIWDEELLKQLLDQSTSYEERRKLRARLRQVMAEKEACADIVASVTAELKQQKLDDVKSKKMEVKQTKKEETEEEEEDEYTEEEYEEEVTEEDEESEKVTTKVEVKTNDSKIIAKDKQATITTTTATTAAAATAAATKTIITSNKIEDKKEQSSQGESLLLPLLQGLLHKKTAQHSNATKSPNKQDNSVTHIEDSGTESGEDLKLLAAGLHDHMNKESTVPGVKSHRESIVQADLLAEVTTALNRLQATLRDGKDIDLDMNKRNALLTLVSRLQIGLVSPDQITDQPGPSGIVTELSAPDVESKIDIGRKSAGQGRFAKRRNRQGRHTVGVSQEELADARRYIEELLMMENLSNCGTPDVATTPPEYNISKQSSAASVLASTDSTEPSVLFRPNQFIPNATTNNQVPPLANDTFVQMRDKKPKYKFSRQSLSFDQQIDVPQTSRRPFSEAFNVKQLSQPDAKQNSATVIQNVMQKVGKFSKAAEMERPDYSSEDEHVFSKNAYNKTYHSGFDNKSQNTIFNGMLKCRRSRTPPGKSIDDDSFSQKENKMMANRFTNKKLKMKRANTIDIPKASNYLGGHDNEYDDDDDNEFQVYKEDSPIGLKGTVQPNAKVAPKKVVPTFKPKTENDHKFLAFLQKQNTGNGPTWTNPNRVPQSTNSHNWSNAFGNIKNTFEGGSEAISNRKPPMAGLSSARNFWKQTENVKPTKTSTRNTLFSNILMKQNSLDEKSSSRNVVIGSLRIRDNVPVNGHSGTEANKFVVPKPVPINEFSHAPLSAFQPIQRKIEPPSFKPIPDPKFIPNINTVSQLTNGFHNISAQQNQSKPLPLTSPTRNLSNSFSPHNTQPKSPTSVLPWSNRINADHRVLNLAATKFDVKSPPLPTGKISPRANSFRSYAPPQHIPNNTTGARLQQKRGSLPNETSYSYFNEDDVPNLHQTKQNTQMNENVLYNPPKLQQTNYYAPSLPNLSNNRQDVQPCQPAPNLPAYKPSNSYTNMQSPTQPLYYSQPPPPYTMPKSPSSYQSYPQSPPIYQSVKSPIQRNSDSFKQSKPPPSYPTTNRSFANDSPRSFGNESHRLQQNNQTQSYRPPPPSYQQKSSTQVPPMNYQPLPPANYQPLPPANYQPPPPSNYQPPPPANYQQPPPANYQQPPPANYQPPHPTVNYQQPPPPKNYQQPSSYQPSIPNQTTSNYQPKPSNYRPEPQQSNYDSPTTEFPAYPYTCTDYTQPACVSTYIPKVTVTMDPSDSLTNPSAEPLVLSNTRPIYSPNNKPELLKIFDYPSSSENSPQSSVSPLTPHDTLDDMDDDLELQEYTAKTQVMRGPVSQTAVTVSNKVTSRNGPTNHGKGSEAAMSLQSVLKNIIPKSPDVRTEIINKYAKDVSDIAKRTFQSNPVNVQKILDAQPTHVKQSVIGNTKTTKTTSFKPPVIVETPSTPLVTPKKPDFPTNVVYNNVSTSVSHQVKPDTYNQSYASQTIERSANGDTVLSSNFHIPLNTSMYHNDAYHPPTQRRSPIALSKSDSWHQICQTNQKPPSPHNFPDQRPLQRTKSGHSLTIPKQFEAGIKKTEVTEKQKTVAAYFSGQKSPQSLSRSSSQQNVNETTTTNNTKNSSQKSTTTIRKKSQVTRIKTSEKASISKQMPSSGLARSHTMPHIVNMNYLDETNVEDAFEDLFNESMS